MPFSIRKLVFLTQLLLVSLGLVLSLRLSRGKFRTLPNIYDGALLREQLVVNCFRKKTFIVNIRLGFKFASSKGKVVYSFLNLLGLC